MPLLDAALAWAGRGFRVFPLSPGTKIPPKGFAWKAEATRDPAKLTAWWSQYPNCNIGVATGDGLVVVDVDAHKPGALGALLALDLPDDTLTVKTPGGGFHLYYLGDDVANSANKLGPGIDVRGAGGYVVAPGSFFADSDGAKGYTGHYQIQHDTPAVVAPPHLILMAGSPRERQDGGPVSVDDPMDIDYATRYLQNEAPLSIEGQGGNDTAFRVAARLIEIGVSAETMIDLLAEHWNPRCAPPWARDDLVGFAQHAELYAQNRQGSGGAAVVAEAFSAAVPLELAAPAGALSKMEWVFSQTTLPRPEDIKPLPWLAYKMLLRNQAAVLAGPGGAGKSALSLTLAVAGAAGRTFAKYSCAAPFRTVFYDLEDTRETMAGRVYAACATHGLDPEEAQRNLLLWPGEDLGLRIMDRNHMPKVDALNDLVRLTKANGFDALVLGPLSSLHAEDENDNVGMGEVMRLLNQMARAAGVAVLTIAHTAKGQHEAGDSGAIRGAGNITQAVRMASTVYAASKDDADQFGLGPDWRSKYLRVDDAKANLSPLDSAPVWLERVPFMLPQGVDSYSLRVMEASQAKAGEADLIAGIIGNYMRESATMHLASYDAAKVLAERDVYFREKLPATGNLHNLRALIEARLTDPVTVPGLGVVSIKTQTKPGDTAARRYVVLD